MPEQDNGAPSLESMLRSYADMSSNDEVAEPSVNESAQVANEPETSDLTEEVVKEESEDNAESVSEGGTLEDANAPKKLPKKDEGERQKKVLSAFSQKQEAFKKEREAFEAERKSHLEEIKKLREETESYVAQKKREAEEASIEKDTEFSAEQWEEVAERWESQGRVEDAKAAKAQAKIVRQKQAKANEIKTQKQMEAMRAEAKKWDDKALEENPELKDQNSEFFKEVKAIYNGQGDLNKLPRGLYLATEYAKQKLAASKVPELEKQVGELQKQLAQAKEKLTAPSGASGKSTPKDAPAGSIALDDMSLEDKLKLAAKMNL